MNRIDRYSVCVVDCTDGQLVFDSFHQVFCFPWNFIIFSLIRLQPNAPISSILCEVDSKRPHRAIRVKRLQLNGYAKIILISLLTANVCKDIDPSISHGSNRADLCKIQEDYSFRLRPTRLRQAGCKLLGLVLRKPVIF